MTYTGIVQNGVVKLPPDWKDGTPVQVESVERASTMPERQQRKDWLARLSELRESMATGKTGPTSDEILDDLRADRT